MTQDEIKTFLFLKFGPNVDDMLIQWVQNEIQLTREERIILGFLLDMDDDQLLDLKALANSERN